MQAAEPKDLNPYVAVVAKKYRNLKKKLEKIAKAETQLAQGKVLDEEQKILLSSKKAIEKSVAEILSIKQQLEEVAKSEEETVVKTVQPEPVSQPDETVQVVEDVEETLPVTESVEVATHTETTEQLVASTMTEPEEEVEVPPAEPQVDLKAFLADNLERLVKALHVYERYENVTSNPLPDNVSYFGKTLLGLTSISSFQETVNNSLRTAKFYLDEELASTNDIVRGTSYVRLGQQIDALVEEMERVQQRGTNNALTALLRTTISSSSSAAVSNTHNTGNGNASPAVPVVSAPVPAPAEPVYDSSLYGAHDSFNSGLQFGNHGLVNFGHHQGYYASQQPAEPVYVAPTVNEVYHAPVELSAAPAVTVPIAPTLPDLVAIEEEPVHEEQVEVSIAPAVSEVVVEEVVEEVPEEAVVTTQEQQPAGGRRQDKGAKNVRVRGDRATRPRPEPKAAPAAPVVETKKEPLSFKDRVMIGKAAAPAPAPVVVEAPVVATAPVVAESAAPAVSTEETTNGNKKTKPARKENKKSADVEGEVAAVDASADPVTTSAVKNKRERRERSPRKEHKDAAPAEVEAPKKTSYLSAIGGVSSVTAPSSAPVAVESTAGADAKRSEVRRAPRKPVTESAEGAESAPRAPRSSTKPTYNNTSSTSSGNFRERREKKVEATPAAAPAHAAAPVEDGFQQVSRRSAPSADKKPTAAVHKPRPATATGTATASSSSGAPRVPKPAAATSSAK